MNEENISNDDREASSNNTFDLALRPKKLNDFIGQKKVQGNLSTFIKADISCSVSIIQSILSLGSSNVS